MLFRHKHEKVFDVDGPAGVGIGGKGGVSHGDTD
jgi:hypothetical protein